MAVLLSRAQRVLEIESRSAVTLLSAVSTALFSLNAAFNDIKDRCENNFQTSQNIQQQQQQKLDEPPPPPPEILPRSSSEVIPFRIVWKKCRREVRKKTGGKKMPVGSYMALQAVARLTRFKGRGHKKVPKGPPLLRFFEKISKTNYQRGGGSIGFSSPPPPIWRECHAPPPPHWMRHWLQVMPLRNGHVIFELLHVGFQ